MTLAMSCCSRTGVPRGEPRQMPQPAGPRAGFRIHVLPIGKVIESPPRIVEVEPPVQASLGAMALVPPQLVNSLTEPCTLRLLDPDGHIVDARPVSGKGRDSVLLRLTPRDSGSFTYTVQAVAGGKVVDQRPARITVAGPPRLLVVDDFPKELGPFLAALRQTRMPVDVIHPEQWPDDLSPYAAVVLSDLSGAELSPDQALTLKQYVEQLGGGVVFVGGRNVVPALWRKNLLYDLLPVRLREPPAKVIKREPEVAVCFVVDRSGSMDGVLPGSSAAVSKLELVKASVIASLQSLPETTTVCLITFNNSMDVVVPPTSVKQREAISKLVDQIAVGGGTEMYPAARRGLEMLKALPGEKYFILLTDGQSLPPPGSARWEDLPAFAAQEGFSWTSIAVGDDADQNLLRSLANRAGGRYAYCATGDQIPRVFIQETQTIRRVAAGKPKSFRPRAGPDARELGGHLPSIQWPTLNGSLPADSRTNSRTVLFGLKSDPLLAIWQYGAGRVAAFCSDAKADWAGNWFSDASFPRFWDRTVSLVAQRAFAASCGGARLARLGQGAVQV